MRRFLLVLTVAALMAAMVVTAGPAKADISIGGGDSSFGGSSFGDSSFGGSSFGAGFTNVVFFSQVNSEVGDFEPGGIEFS
jgi:hypothetical protein